MSPSIGKERPKKNRFCLVNIITQSILRTADWDIKNKLVKI